jgi:hypothetical protein
VTFRSGLVGDGKTRTKNAKAKAAAIYNAKHPSAPVTGKHKPKKKK